MKYKKDTGYHLTQCLNLIYPKGHAFFTDNRQDTLKDLADEVSKLDQMPKQLMTPFFNGSSKNEVTWSFLKLWAKSPVVMLGGIFYSISNDYVFVDRQGCQVGDNSKEYSLFVF